MIRLAEPDPDWPRQAAAEIARWQAALDGLLAVHHIGSTAVPGLMAKPILDLLPVFTDGAAADTAEPGVRDLGYDWLGAYGLPGRRYARYDDPRTGRRRVQAHCYPDGHPDIARHLAFRDALRADPALAADYAAVKRRCAGRHPDDLQAYGDCKSPWIIATEAMAIRLFR